MEITDNEVSAFHDVLLDKDKVLENENKKMIEPSQSSHIGADLVTKGAEPNVDDVNKDSDSTLDTQRSEESPSTCTEDDGNESQIPLRSEENIKTDIPESCSVSLARSGNQSSQMENEGLLVSIVHKNEANLVLYEERGLEKSNASESSPSHTSFESKGSNPETVKSDNSEINTVPYSMSIQAASSSVPDELSHVSKPSPSHLTHETPKMQLSSPIPFAIRPPSKESHLATVQSVRSKMETLLPGVSAQLASSSVPEEVSHVSQSSPPHLTPAILKTQPSSPIPAATPPPSPKVTEECNRLQEQLKNSESQIDQLKKALSQKDNTITLYQRENALLEKEKSAFRKEKELATKEKESIVITFATKEKSLIDAKKQKESIEKQLADSRKEVKNISTKFHALNEEKSRITYMLDDKCNEVKKFQKELEKQKADFNNLEIKFKWNMVKLAQETEAKFAAEKKLEEERNAPKPAEEKANEKLRVEYEATTILLKHELEKKDKAIESLTKEHKQAIEKISQLQDGISKEILENTSISRELECIRQEHAVVQNSYSDEMLNSAKLRGQLEELQVLRTQHTINEDKISTLNANLRELEDKVQDSAQDLDQLHIKERELLSINKEMSEMIVGLQNQICLQASRVKGVEAENEILKKEKLDFDTKYNEIEVQLKQEVQQKNDERQLLTKHLSEKTKLYESVKVKLDNAQGDLEATKKKHSQVVKELQRELQKYKKSSDANTSPSSPTTQGFCRNCQLKSTSQEQIASNHSRGSNHSRSDSESEAQSTTSTMNRDVQGPSKQHLVERILRLQQASARQTEKIDFLENHTLSLVAELQKKSKVVQYYMMRDQAGALTSCKSDQNKSELAKYGGVMSAIYSGIKGPNQSMTLELSLEINKKLQAVLEDTLLKNITLKENLDVLGLEVDKLTRKLAQIKS